MKTRTTAALIALLALSTPAHAESGAASLAHCRSMAEMARQIAIARDKGTPEDKTLALIMTLNGFTNLDRNTYVKTTEILYQNPGLTPDGAYSGALAGCLEGSTDAR